MPALLAPSRPAVDLPPGATGPSRPPAALRTLRPPVASRPPVDRGLAGGLRAWLDDELAAALPGGGKGPERRPLVVDRWALAAPRHPDAAPGTAVALTEAGARQALVGALFRQAVVSARIGEPFDDALAALRVSAWGGAVVDFVASLPRPTRTALRQEVTAAGRAMAADVYAVPASWLPRATARRVAPLAGGAVVLRATASLALGQPAAERSSVCLVDVRAGEPRGEHGEDRCFLALVETLCAGAPPCRVATYYPACGRVTTLDPTDEDLASAVVGVVAAVRRQIGAPGAGHRVVPS